jgi:microcystin-dependent protein
MASTPTTRNRFNKQGTGDNSGTWGGVLNTQTLDLIDESADGITAITVSGNVTLTSTNYVTDQSRRRTLRLSGSPGATYIITVPSVEKFYWVINQSDAAQTIKAGGTGVSVPAGSMLPVICDGTDCFTQSTTVTTLIGAVTDYAGTAVPSGWLPCAGQTVSRTTYAALFGAIGTTWGAGNGTTTFNVPDLRGRVTAGPDIMEASGDAGRLTDGTLFSGTRTSPAAILGSASHTLTTAQLPAHDHNYDKATFVELANAADPGALDTNIYNYTGVASTSSETIGSGSAHNNLQPTATILKIIYAGV